jgi:AraC-like DNA-binding protein
MDIVYAGRAVIRRGVRDVGIPELRIKPAGHYLCVLVCEKGGGIYYDHSRPDGIRSSQVVGAGSGIIAGADVWVNDLTDTEYHVLGVVLRADDTRDFESLMALAAGGNTASPDGASLPVLDDACVSRLLPHLEEIGWEYRQRQSGWKTAVRGRFDLLRTELRRWAAAGEFARLPERDGPAVIRRAHAYFEEHLCRRGVCLEDAARAAGLSPKRLIAVFRECRMPSPMAYLRGLRMRKARQLLCDGAMSVKEVAAAVGASSPTVLGRTYRRFFNVAPREERLRSRVFRAMQTNY